MWSGISLQIWLPMTQNISNCGLYGDLKFTLNNGVIKSEGKLGKCHSGYWIHHADTDILSDNQWTISCWMKANSFGPNNDILMCKNNDSSEACQYYMSIIDGKTFNLGINGSAFFAQYSLTFSTGVWYHLAATFDGSNFKMYINGEIVRSGTCNNKYILCSNIGLGCRSTNSAGTASTGSSDKYCNDFRIYDHCLSPKEIKLISQALVLHYPMGTIDGKIAGRNLLQKPTIENGSLFGSMSELKTKTFSGWDFYCERLLVDIDWNNHIGDYLTYRCYVENIEQTAGTGTGIMLHFFYADNTYTQYGGGKNGVIGSFLVPGEKGYLTITAKIPDPSVRPNPTTIKYVRASIRHNSTDGNSTVNFKDAKVELGRTPTPWTPAPEDVPQWYDNIVYDTSGFMNNGTVTDSTAPTWDSDSPRYRGSYVFDGNNSIQISHPIFYDDVDQQHTVCAWVYLASYDLFQCLINLNLGYYITWGSTRTLMHLNDSSNDSYVYGDSLPLNEWTHVTWVLDTNIQRCEVYYNGKLNAKSLNYASNDTPNGVNKNVVVGNKFNGKISDLRVYATALSSSDIESLYKTSASVTQNGTLLLAGEVIE